MKPPSNLSHAGVCVAMLIACSTSCFAQRPLSVSPSRLDMGRWPYHATATPQNITLMSTSTTYTIKSATLASGRNFSVRALKPLPYVIHEYDSLLLQVTFTPQDVGAASDNLVVTYSDPSSGPQTLAIPVTGTGECSELIQGCDPVGSTCKINENHEKRLIFTQPNYYQSVSPAITTVVTTHYSQRPSYALPISFLWQIAGLGDLFDDPSPGINCCQRNIQFTHVAGSRTKATFVRQADSDLTLVSKAIPNSQIKVTMTIPANLTGTVVAAGGYVDFFFPEASSPTLTIQDGTNTIFPLGKIQCIGATPLVGTVRRPLGDPNINMLVKPQ